MCGVHSPRTFPSPRQAQVFRGLHASFLRFKACVAARVGRGGTTGHTCAFRTSFVSRAWSYSWARGGDAARRHPLRPSTATLASRHERIQKGRRLRPLWCESASSIRLPARQRCASAPERGSSARGGLRRGALRDAHGAHSNTAHSTGRKASSESVAPKCLTGNDSRPVVAVESACGRVRIRVRARRRRRVRRGSVRAAGKRIHCKNFGSIGSAPRLRAPAVLDPRSVSNGDALRMRPDRAMRCPHCGRPGDWIPSGSNIRICHATRRAAFLSPGRESTRSHRWRKTRVVHFRPLARIASTARHAGLCGRGSARQIRFRPKNNQTSRPIQNTVSVCAQPLQHSHPRRHI